MLIPMDGFDVALIFGLILLLAIVMYLVSKIQRLHQRARELRRIVRKLEGKEDKKRPVIENEMGG